MSKTKSYEFTTDKTPQELFELLPARLTAYSREMSESFALRQTDDGFRLSMERGGHTDYWYCAHVEQIDGVTHIRGEILHHPKKAKQHKSTLVLKIIVYPILIALLAIPVLIIELIEKILHHMQDLPTPLTQEQKLIQFMTERMGCELFETEAQTVTA